MSTYAIGDVQGCCRELDHLLRHVDFDEQRDHLWLVGDLVNRGPDSLGVLRRVRALGARAITVLGNHDFHLLARAIGVPRIHNDSDTLQALLDAPDSGILLDWLRHRPLLHHDPESGYTMVHAGLVPQWDLVTAQRCAAEVEAVLAGPEHAELLKVMHGDEPTRWSPRLQGWERIRCIINGLTRLRFCDDAGRMALCHSVAPGRQPPGLHPWFTLANRRSRSLRIIFGHWSTLRQAGLDCARYGVFPLDDGCVWGGQLSAMRLEDGLHFSVPSCTRARG